MIRSIGAAVGRKAKAVAQRVPRTVRRWRARPHDYSENPPVVVTTVPKSGTHLVHQIATALPGTVDYGTFIATTVSWRRKPRSVATLCRLIDKLAPGEVVRAHLIHTPEVVSALQAKNACVVFVYRDPRDVIVSETHYLADAAPWHSLHRAFAPLTPSQRIDLAITGLPKAPELYPDVAERYHWYEGWLEDAGIAVRFEDLVGDQRDRVVEEIIRSYAKVSSGDVDVPATASGAIRAIAPERSHTFRKGQAGGWREVFTEDQLNQFNRIASATLERYGYQLTTSL